MESAVVPFVKKTSAAKSPEPERTKLRKRDIDALKPRVGERYVSWDVDPPGFGVRVSSKAKTFVLKFRLKSGRVRWATIARVGVIALEEARNRARRMRGEVADNKDPLAAIDLSRGAVTIAQAADQYVAEYLPKLKPRTSRNYASVLAMHIKPIMGTIPIRDLTTDDVRRLHNRIRQHAPIQANRVVATLSSMLTWSMDEAKLREKGPNPCEGVDKCTENKREVYLDEAQYARLGAVLRKARRTKSLSEPVLMALDLLLVTGARPDEIVSLQWSEVDLKSAALRLADSKTGARTIPLAPDAVGLLKRWPRFAGSPFIFPGRGQRDKGDHMHADTLSHVWLSIRKEAQLGDMRLYDAVRHSWASTAISDHDLSLPQVGGQLGHKNAATTQRYAHLKLDAARRNATAIGGTITASLKRRAKKSDS